MTDSVSAVGGAPATGLYTTAPTRAPKQTLDSDAMMQLLVTQLKNQDPSSPMDTNAMISQTTQLSAMQQLVDLSSNSNAALALQMRDHAANLVGKTVTYDDGAGVTKTGLVTGVKYSGTGNPTVSLGDTSIELASVLGVATTAS
ncbi:flagellar hook capping FlgD N-terminal domain-containing protein [Curtobacterium sp. MCSS17_016]|uniref:flagellar hook capping FlgD N-terminal domain-containing protein n=1 Tax=Curtobacterium sp. MCSS17_016 TaxID=2175644 RepID=UPI0021AC8928|nr:flagellar hook capping FlgD N-terminal domain-containing protein [Curtobacterium sp. MCSS17_016]WIE80907.1 flagellar hook capping FlgD N-terminal domain-containing protein [Curtobacterium sp. MCSS17_016]